MGVTAVATMLAILAMHACSYRVCTSPTSPFSALIFTCPDVLLSFTSGEVGHFAVMPLAARLGPTHHQPCAHALRKGALLVTGVLQLFSLHVD